MIALVALLLAAESGFVEVRSDHFVVSAHLDEPSARALTLRLEGLRAGILHLLFKGASLQGARMPVIVVRDHRELAEYADENVGGFATWGLTGERLFAVDEETDARGSGLLPHELAHPLLDAFIQQQPRWLAEGLGGFFETLRVDDDGKIKAGTPPPPILHQLAAMDNRPLLVKDLRGWKKISFGDENRGLYATSWLLVHWLIFTHGPAFAKLQSLLGEGADPDKVLALALPGLTDEQIDSALSEWLIDRLAGAQWPVMNASMAPPAPQLTVKALPEAEAEALKATLAVLAPADDRPAERKKKVAARVAAALKLDPANVTALLVQRRLEPKADLSAQFRAAAAANPKDWRAPWALAKSLPDTPENTAERLKALQTAARLSPFSAPALHDLALAQLDAGNVREGLAYASGAARLFPSNPVVLATYAAALYRAGKCAEAVRMRERAAREMWSDAPEQLVRTIEKRLDQYAGSCR